jgi:hypothetical protein
MKPLQEILKEWEEERLHDLAANEAYWAEYKARVLACPHCGRQPVLSAYLHSESGPYAAVICCSRVEHYGGSIEASVSKAFYRWNQRI